QQCAGTDFGRHRRERVEARHSGRPVVAANPALQCAACVDYVFPSWCKPQGFPATAQGRRSPRAALTSSRLFTRYIALCTHIFTYECMGTTMSAMGVFSAFRQFSCWVWVVVALIFAAGG